MRVLGASAISAYALFANIYLRRLSSLCLADPLIQNANPMQRRMVKNSPLFPEKAFILTKCIGLEWSSAPIPMVEKKPQSVRPGRFSTVCGYRFPLDNLAMRPFPALPADIIIIIITSNTSGLER